MAYKILIILSRAFDPNAGGVQRSTYKMSSYFKSQGHEAYVFSYDVEGHIEQDVAQLFKAEKPGRHYLAANNDRLQTIIKDIRPDIIINQMPYDKEIGRALLEVKNDIKFLLLCCLRNTLFVVKLNLESYLNSVIPKPIQPIINNSFGKKLLLEKHKRKHAKDLKFILDTYDYFVLFGPPNKKELEYFVGDYKLNKTHFIPNSILSVLDDVPKKEKRILWLSRVTYKQKRADLILPLWKKIMHQLPDWQLDIVGDGDAFEDLKTQIQNENLPRVRMYGKQTPYKYYERSPIYIMTSAYEGFPNTLIEAQSHACIPIVYDNYPICSWVLKNGKSGRLIPPFDVDDMAKNVIQIAQNPKLQKNLMQASLLNAKEFDLQNVGRQWIEFFDRELK